LFERPKAGERAILVHLEMHNENQREDGREFTELAVSAGANPVVLITGKGNPTPRYFVGQGKLEEIQVAAVNSGAELVLFNHALSPSQERNIEQTVKLRVLDRTGLILDIFAQRARTHEGKLQVELAQLEYLSTRLVRGWSHLERQKGGIGLRGPGETQLETDRRLLRARIKSITKRLRKVRQQRDQGRKARRKADIPTISLVGYTNAGKSTLFNQLTSSEVYAADQLFATLDPTLRRLQVSGVGSVVMADTVGFIRHLPHKLVDAFRATLEETRSADMLIHVVDASDPNRMGNIESVNSVLSEIEADQIPQLLVLNKIDCMENTVPRVERDHENRPARVWLSAKTGAGFDLLGEALAACLATGIADMHVKLPPAMASIRARLYEQRAVLSELINDQGEFLIHVKMPLTDWRQLNRQTGAELEDYRIDPN